MIFFIISAIAIIAFLLWQLYRARQFNHFKKWLKVDIAPKLVTSIKTELIEQRTEQTPNNDSHIEASVYFWTQYSSRILQAAIEKDIITIDELKAAGKYRHCQHLFFIEQDKLVQRIDTLSANELQEDSSNLHV